MYKTARKKPEKPCKNKTSRFPALSDYFPLSNIFHFLATPRLYGSARGATEVSQILRQEIAKARVKSPALYHICQ